MFQFEALDPEALDLSQAQRLEVTADPGFPCRVSLRDAAVGETVYAFCHTHHDVSGPYRGSGPIFVRESAVRARPAPGEVPTMLLHRQLSVRAYDADAMMVDAAVLAGTELADHIHQRFADPAVAYLHVHNAGPGCFDCAVLRA